MASEMRALLPSELALLFGLANHGPAVIHAVPPVG